MAKKRNTKFKRVRKLFDNVNGGDCVDSVAEVKELLEDFMVASTDVLNNWEHGDLAGAVNHLQAVLDRSEKGWS